MDLNDTLDDNSHLFVSTFPDTFGRVVLYCNELQEVFLALSNCNSQHVE